VLDRGVRSALKRRATVAVANDAGGWSKRARPFAKLNRAA
jgi:hypothetical protein